MPAVSGRVTCSGEHSHYSGRTDFCICTCESGPLADISGLRLFRVCAYHCLRAYRQKCRLCPAGCEGRYGSCAGHPAVFDRAGISGACFALPFAGDQPRLCCMESILRHPVSFCIVRDAGRLRKNLVVAKNPLITSRDKNRNFDNPFSLNSENFSLFKTSPYLIRH